MDIIGTTLMEILFFRSIKIFQMFVMISPPVLRRCLICLAFVVFHSLDHFFFCCMGMSLIEEDIKC